jgi:superfamily II DNA/RNA helicase
MLDMGFIPAVERIVELCPRDRQTLFFSATLDGMAGKIAKQFTTDPAHHEHRAPQEKKANIEHRFVLLNHDSKLKRLVGELGDQWDLNLVFVRTKRGADRLCKRLAESGVKANAMHGDKTQRQREKALADFEAGRVTTLVATDVAARGIHVDSIAKVINFDIPAQTEDYVHRVGRTGRAGERGVAVTFVCGDQMREMKGMTRELRLESQFAEAGENGRTAPVHVEREPGERPVRKERNTTGDRPRQHAGESNGERSGGGGNKKRRHRNPKSGVGKGSGKPSGKSKTHRKGQSRNANPNANGEGGHSAGPRNGGGNGHKSGSRNGGGSQGGHGSNRSGDRSRQPA